MAYVISPELSALGIRVQDIKNKTGNLQRRLTSPEERAPILEQYDAVLKKKIGKIQKISQDTRMTVQEVVKTLPLGVTETLSAAINEIARDDTIELFNKLQTEIGFETTAFPLILYNIRAAFIPTLQSLASDETIAKLKVLMQEIDFTPQSLSGTFNKSVQKLHPNVELLTSPNTIAMFKAFKAETGLLADQIASILSSSCGSLQDIVASIGNDATITTINAFQKTTGLRTSAVLQKAIKSFDIMVSRLNNPENVDTIEKLQTSGVPHAIIHKMLRATKCDPQKFHAAASEYLDADRNAEDDGAEAAGDQVEGDKAEAESLTEAELVELTNELFQKY